MQVEATRVIYNGTAVSAAVGLSNKSGVPYLVQAWLDSLDAEDLADIAPDFVDPLSGKTLAELWTQSPERELPMTAVAVPSGA